ncbi:unnamed protein product [Ectocarpus sp. 6 AP-2014]
MLDGNELTGNIPSELGDLRQLQLLLLSDNHLTGQIPKELGDLSELKELWLSDNQLTGPIPPALGKLPALQGLYLQGNQLSGPIPPGLGKLAALQHLTLQGNHLSGLIPKELGALSELEKLFLGGNRLTGIVPKELGKLKLQELQLGGNELSGLSQNVEQSLQVRGLLLSLRLYDDNRWKTPPEDIVRGGLGTIVDYWQAIERSGSVESWKLKVVLVGAVKAGKTSLVRGMVHGEVRLCKENDRTKGVDVHVNDPCKPDASRKLELIFWDFAGHSEYYSTHQLFLSEGALYLLVVHLERFVECPWARGDLIGVWLDALQCRVPGASFLVVANQREGWEGGHGAVLKKLRDAVEGHLKAKRRELERARQGSESSEMPSGLGFLGVESVSAASAESLRDLRRKLATLAESKYLFPDVGKPFPVSWERVRATLEAKRSGNDPVSAASRISADAGNTGVPLAGLAAPDTSGVKVKFLRWNDGVREWGQVVRALKLEGEIGMTMWDRFMRLLRIGSLIRRIEKEEVVFKSAVGLLVREGTILSSGDVLYVEPTWINELLRAILDHQLTEKAKEGFWDEELKRFALDRSAPYVELRKVHNNFCDTGTLTVGYLRFLWRNVFEDADEEIFKGVLETMSHHGVMFKSAPARTSDEDVEREFDNDVKLFVPVRLPSQMLQSDIPDFETLRRHQYREEIVYDIHQSYAPPGVLGLLMSHFLCREGVRLHTCWSRGAAFAMGGPVVFLYVTALDENGARETADITAQVFGLEFSGALHNAVQKVEEIIEAVFAEYFRGVYVNPRPDYPRIVRGQDAALEKVDSLQAQIKQVGAQLGDIGNIRNKRMPGFEELIRSFKDECMEGLGQVKSVLDDVRNRVAHNKKFLENIKNESLRQLEKIERVLDDVRTDTIQNQTLDIKDESLQGLGRIEGELRDVRVQLDQDRVSAENVKIESFRRLEQVESVLNALKIHIGRDTALLNDIKEEGLRRLEQIKGELASLQDQTNRDEGVASLERLVARDDGVMGRLDALVAMVMRERAEKVSAPRFVCVLPPWNFAEKRGLSPEEMAQTDWTKRYIDWREDDFKDGKHTLKTEMLIFPVCAFSGELVPCGHNGQGYRVECARKLVRTATSGFKSLVSGVAGPVGRAEPMTAPGMAAAKSAANSAAKKAQPGDWVQFAATLRNKGLGKDKDELIQELKGNDYESVREFIHGMEIRTRDEINSAWRKVHKVRRGDGSIPDFIFFEEKMVKVQARDGDGAVQWVLEDHEDAWYEKMRPASLSSVEST